MSGLFIKDIRLLMQRKRFLIMFAFLAVTLSYATDGTFIISYLTMVGSMLALSTISLDEFDNGFSFLFSLPVSRKNYAAEKYLFSYIWLGICWFIGVLLQVIMTFAKGEAFASGEFLTLVFVFLAVFMVVLAIMIPIELKFGVEKSRVAMFAVVGICFVIGILIAKIMESMGIDLSNFAERADGLPIVLLPATLIVAALIVSAVSYFITIGIMEKKEF